MQRPCHCGMRCSHWPSSLASQSSSAASVRSHNCESSAASALHHSRRIGRAGTAPMPCPPGRVSGSNATQTVGSEHTARARLAYVSFGFDHGVGHSLLLLSDAKASHAQKSKEFNGLGHYPSNISIRLLQTATKRIIHTTI